MIFRYIDKNIAEENSGIQKVYFLLEVFYTLGMFVLRTIKHKVNHFQKKAQRRILVQQRILVNVKVRGHQALRSSNLRTSLVKQVELMQGPLLLIQQKV